MTTISITEFNGELVVDSRLVAEKLGIEHESFVRTIRKYQTRIEQQFGLLRFEIGVKKGDRGGERPQYVLLNESQATVLMTLSRNTDQVTEAKFILVDAFAKAKQRLTQMHQSSQMLPEQRLQIGMSALQFFGIDQTNPRLAQGLQDWCLNLMLNQKQLMPVEDLWVGVAERAEELGYGRIGADLSLRTRLGQAVAKLQLDRKKEKRLCNGTQREIWIYRVCDELDNGIRLFFQVESAIAPQ